ncbi:hypothetical protein L2E82_04092 [Cichorium intybus]|uniref:Uncharacterized protein n=1 Tax=Cichorium intybus TaxID=13427 RepID=A0ACB9H653_CICIN|nr:hypothetical protein L2E82_04092 [Cichorium intybus]
MSGTMSRSNNQWLQFYENNQPTTVQSWSGDAATDATVVTTNNTSVSNQLNRVSRPTNTRRRSRASRRTPTTLLNTDTTNFRAMVQRFTGGGNNGGDATSGPYLSNESSITSNHQLLSTYNSNTYSFGDGVGSSSSGMAALRPNDGYNVQFRQPQSQPYFTMTVEDGGSTTANDGDDQHMGFRQSGSYNW